MTCGPGDVYFSACYVVVTMTTAYRVTHSSRTPRGLLKDMLKVSIYTEGHLKKRETKTRLVSKTRLAGGLRSHNFLQTQQHF